MHSNTRSNAHGSEMMLWPEEGSIDSIIRWEHGGQSTPSLYGGQLTPPLFQSTVRSIITRIKGKYMIENKKLSDRKRRYQFLRRWPNQNRTIAYDIVNRDSNEKQVFKVPDNNVIDVTSPALNTSQRKMPMLGIERRSARWHGWLQPVCQLLFWRWVLYVWICCNFCVLQKLPS